MSGSINAIPLLVTNTYDPNWYLSTIAQSTAALVAILGGFVISRIMALSSEKNSIIEKISELEGRKSILQTKLQEFENDMHLRAMLWFRQDSVNAIANDPDLDIDELIKKEIYPGENIERKGEFAGKLIEKSRHYHSVFTKDLEHLERLPIESGGLGREGIIFTNKFEEKLAIVIALKLNEDRDRKARELLETQFADPANAGNMTLQMQVRMNRLSDKYRPSATQQVQNYLKDPWVARNHGTTPEKRLETLDAIRSLELEEKVYRDLLSKKTEPSGLRLGFVVLFYFAVVGIMIPVMVMSRNPVRLRGSGRDLIIVLFGSGLLSLIGYIGLSMRAVLIRK